MEQTLFTDYYKNVWRPLSDFDLVRYESIMDWSNPTFAPFKRHTLDLYMVVLYTEGSGFQNLDFKDYPCLRGTMLTVRPGVVQTLPEWSSLRGFVLTFTEEFLDSYLTDENKNQTIELFNELLYSPRLQFAEYDLIEILQIVKAIREEKQSKTDDYSKKIIRGYLEVLLNRLARNKRLSATRSQRSTHYMNDFLRLHSLVEKYCNKTKTVTDFAEMMHVSTKTINNITSSVIDKPAKRFIDEIYTLQTERLLSNSALSTKQISEVMGFDDLSNFYKYFKKQSGGTPDEFRKKVK